MTDNKQNPATGELVTPEAGGPESPGDVVVDFEKINDLVKQRTAEKREAVEQAEADKAPEGGDAPSPGIDEEDTREPWEKTQDELNAENQKPRRGRPPKAAEQTGPEDKTTRKGRPPKADKTAPDKTAPDKTTTEKTEKQVRDNLSQSPAGLGAPQQAFLRPGRVAKSSGVATLELLAVIIPNSG